MSDQIWSSRSPVDQVDQFDGQMLIHCRGLPWQYSVQGILMKTKFAARQRLADAAEEATGEEQVEKEAKMIGEQVAIGMYGHGPVTPGLPPDGYPKTPGRTPMAPTPETKTPASRTPVAVPMPATPARPAPKTPAAPVRPPEPKSAPLDPRSLRKIDLVKVGGRPPVLSKGPASHHRPSGRLPGPLSEVGLVVRLVPFEQIIISPLLLQCSLHGGDGEFTTNCSKHVGALSGIKP